MTARFRFAPPVAALLCALAAAPALACSCRPPTQSPEQLLNAGARVVLGDVWRRERLDHRGRPLPAGASRRQGQIRYTIRVRKSLNGAGPGFVTVRAAAGAARCGVRIRRRGAILILGPRRRGEHWVSLCGQLRVHKHRREWRRRLEAAPDPIL